jgi:hypothetical protein
MFMLFPSGDGTVADGPGDGLGSRVDVELAVDAADLIVDAENRAAPRI